MRMRIYFGAIELQGVHHREGRSIFKKKRERRKKVCTGPGALAMNNIIRNRKRICKHGVLASRNLSAVKIFVLPSAAMTIAVALFASSGIICSAIGRCIRRAPLREGSGSEIAWNKCPSEGEFDGAREVFRGGIFWWVSRRSLFFLPYNRRLA